MFVALATCLSVGQLRHISLSVFLAEMLTTFSYQVIWRRHSPVQRSPALLTAAFRHGWRGCNAAGKQFLLGWKRIAFSRLTYRIYKVFNVNTILYSLQIIKAFASGVSVRHLVPSPAFQEWGDWEACTSSCGSGVLAKSVQPFAFSWFLRCTRAWGEFSCQVGRLQVKWPWWGMTSLGVAFGKKTSLL